MADVLTVKDWRAAAVSEIVTSLRNVYPTHPMVLKAAAKLEQQARVLADIAGSMKRGWLDPAEHANWCVERAAGIITGDALTETAPELLDALRMVLEANRDEPHIPSIALARIESVIAKAEGNRS